MRSILLWMLGVPIPIIILIALFMVTIGGSRRLRNRSRRMKDIRTYLSNDDGRTQED